MASVNELISKYKKKRLDIKLRLEDFKMMMNEPDEKIFSELSFCICTPQSRAESCNLVIKALENNKILFTGTSRQIRPFMNPVRFADNKAEYIIEARKLFSDKGRINIKNRIKSFTNPFDAREWLLNNVKGFGMKEASHFLRNIGMGEDLAILDRHILKNLYEYGVIEEIPDNLTKNKYLEIEQKMKEFSRIINIPMAELDLLFWSEETGRIFK